MTIAEFAILVGTICGSDSECRADLTEKCQEKSKTEECIRYEQEMNKLSYEQIHGYCDTKEFSELKTKTGQLIIYCKTSHDDPNMSGKPYQRVYDFKLRKVL